MMQLTTDHLLKAYELADSERRMFLFLEHRDLRELFTEIDESEIIFANQAGENHAPATWFSRLRHALVLKWLPHRGSQSPAAQ